MVVTGLFGTCSAEQLVSSGLSLPAAFRPHRFWPSALLSLPLAGEDSRLLFHLATADSGLELCHVDIEQTWVDVRP